MKKLLLLLALLPSVSAAQTIIIQQGTTLAEALDTGNTLMSEVLKGWVQNNNDAATERFIERQIVTQEVFKDLRLESLLEHDAEMLQLYGPRAVRQQNEIRR